MATPAKINEKNIPIVAIVGRVNVGKSTLFNRLTETAHAIVSDVPGTTRTRNIGLVDWRGKNFQLVDTGGLTFDQSVPLEKEIMAQTETALAEASLILFVVDLQSDLLPQEKELVAALRKKFSQTPIVLVGNKADNQKEQIKAMDQQWLKLGLGQPFPISAKSGTNVGDLLDLVFKHLNKSKCRPKIYKPEKPALKVTIVGKPNVGKSSLFNKLIGEARVIVSDMPHTTREPHDILVEVDKERILFVDTAGIRRKSKVSGDLERQGISKSIEAAAKADLALFVLDSGEPITDQDKQLAGFLAEHAKSAIIVINKWDKAEANDDAFRNEVKSLIYKQLPHLDYAPIVFTSALSGYRVHQIFPLLKQAQEGKRISVEQKELDEFLKTILKRHQPSRGKGSRHPKILGMKQTNIDPPIFEVALKQKTSLHSSYVYYLKNRLREKYGFFATPIIIKMKKIKKV